jgi:hypothetical protein
MISVLVGVYQIFLVWKFLDILNELSSAVNSFWNFQIVEGKFQKAADSNKAIFDAVNQILI